MSTKLQLVSNTKAPIKSGRLIASLVIPKELESRFRSSDLCFNAALALFGLHNGFQDESYCNVETIKCAYTLFNYGENALSLVAAIKQCGLEKDAHMLCVLNDASNVPDTLEERLRMSAKDLSHLKEMLLPGYDFRSLTFYFPKTEQEDSEMCRSLLFYKPGEESKNLIDLLNELPDNN